jgi:hypothetical protein
MARRRDSGTVVDRPAGGQETGGSAAPSSQAGAASTAGSGAAASSGRQDEPTLDQIAERAYEIYQSRGGTDGQDMEDWLQAERELRRGFSGE